MRSVFVLFVLALGCKSNVPLPESPGVSTKKDTCSVLPHGCGHEDGCTGAVLPLGEDCAMSAKSVDELDRAVHELLDTPMLTQLVVVAPSLVCANAVRATFEAGGVKEGRVQVAAVENRSFVSFEVLAWNERDCSTGAPAKLPIGK